MYACRHLQLVHRRFDQLPPRVVQHAVHAALRAERTSPTAMSALHVNAVSLKRCACRAACTRARIIADGSPDRASLNFS
jgi:hypothetical protein